MKKIQRGGVMLEALIGMVIFAIGIIGLMESFTVSNMLSGENRYRTEAVTIADEFLGQMAVANPQNLKTDFSGSSDNFQSWLKNRVQTLPNGAAEISFPTTTAPADSFVQLTISWQPPNSQAGATPSEYTTATYFKGASS